MSNIIKIDDFSDSRLDVYARLSEAQLLNRDNPEDGIFIAESPKVVERALNAGYEPISLLLEEKHVDGEAKEIVKRCGDIPIFTAEFNTLTQLTGFQLTRGVLCAMHRKALPGVEEICENARRIAVLENVMNPTNVGAIIRSAAALNMDAVLLTKECSNPLYRRAIRVSMGTVFQIPWTIMFDVDWQNDGIDIMHRLGFKTASFALTDASVSIKNESLCNEEKLAVILGTEGDGLAQSTIENSDYTVKIPMSHGVDSLNVAAAAAVAFWQLGDNK